MPNMFHLMNMCTQCHTHYMYSLVLNVHIIDYLIINCVCSIKVVTVLLEYLNLAQKFKPIIIYLSQFLHSVQFIHIKYMCM